MRYFICSSKGTPSDEQEWAIDFKSYISMAGSSYLMAGNKRIVIRKISKLTTYVNLFKDSL
jgi:hypothetical protein